LSSFQISNTLEASWEIGVWKLEFGSWNLENGVWKLEFGNWNWLLRIGYCELVIANCEYPFALLCGLCAVSLWELCGKKSFRIRGAFESSRECIIILKGAAYFDALVLEILNSFLF
jgi:hypothetical protein